MLADAVGVSGLRGSSGWVLRVGEPFLGATGAGLAGRGEAIDKILTYEMQTMQP
jgi:hypothetical protein